MEVSIIIVTFNCKKLAVECINSVKKFTKNVNYEIIVVDNNSKDKIEDDILVFHPDILFIQNDYNRGFGYANNIGLSYAKGEFIFFLNPDTLLLNNVCYILSCYLRKNILVGALGARVFDENLSNQISFGRFPNTMQYFLEVFPLKYISKNFKSKLSSEGFILDDNNVNVDFISGADLFVRRSVLNKVGGFDEDFFLFYEEVDLCKRIKRAGFQLEIIAEAKIIHLMGKTMNVSFQKFKWFEDSRYIFLRKYYSNLFIIFSKAVFIFRYVFLGIKYMDKECFNRAKYIFRI